MEDNQSIQERLQYLWKLINECVVDQPALSRYYGLTFLKAVKDHNFTVNATVRKELCLHCGSLFQASMNDISIRTRSSRSKCGKKRTLLTSTQLTSSLTEKEKASCKSHHTIRCGVCLHETRIPLDLRFSASQLRTVKPEVTVATESVAAISSTSMNRPPTLLADVKSARKKKQKTKNSLAALLQSKQDQRDQAAQAQWSLNDFLQDL